MRVRTSIHSLPKALSVTTTDEALIVDLDNGRTLSVPLAWYPRLAYGTPAERANHEIVGAGHAIYWPDLDEDIALEQLRSGQASRESELSLACWLRRRQIN